MTCLLYTAGRDDRRRYDAYDRLEKSFAASVVASRRRRSKMAGYRALPMGRDDATAMANPKITAAFERYVKLEEELLTALQDSRRKDRQHIPRTP